MVSARSFLVAFKFSQKLSYMVEFSHHKLRIFADDGAVYQENVGQGENNHWVFQAYYTHGESLKAVAGDNHTDLVIETPYAYDDLWDDEELCFKLQTIQHSDVLYIFSEKYPIMVLKRYSPTDWRLENLELVGGPFEAMNTGDTTMFASAVEGEDIHVYASDDVFSVADEGRLLRLRGYDINALVWTPDLEVSAGYVAVSDNKYYEALSAGACGQKKPVHSEGVRSDGVVLWKYLHAGSGVVKITEFISATEVKAKVLSRLPRAALSHTAYWEMGLLHSRENYPKSGAFFRNRFAFLVNTKEGPKVCLSAVGDYNNFSDLDCGEATAETAITVPVLNTEFNEGKWIFAGDVLFVGTGTAEFYIDTISSSSALANDNVKISKISNVGSKALMPVAVGAHVFFADRYGLSLRDLSYNYYNDGYDQVDISLLGKHLFSTRIVAMCYQEVPDKILWCLMGDGSVTSLTFSVEQEVAALARHDFNGVVESLAVKSDMHVCHDELWLVVKRMINQKTVRSIEFMENGMPLSFPPEISRLSGQTAFEKAEEKFVKRQARYLDAAVLFIREAGDKRTEISGLSHLEGQRVDVFADGKVCPQQLVIGGKIKINAADNSVLVGKAIVSQYLPQPIYLTGEQTSGIGEAQSIDHVALMLHLSGGGKIGADENHLLDILYRPVDGVMGEPQPLFSGIKEVLIGAQTKGINEPALILIENTSPLPMNILAIVPYMS